MNPQQKTLKRLSPQQMALYEIICETKYIRAAGSQIMTCRVLQSTGLIKHSPDSENVNDYVLDGEPVKLPPKVASPKKVAQALIDEPTPAVSTEKSEPELKHVPIEVKPFVRTEASGYSNITREEHVSMWLQKTVKADCETIVKVKCLQEWQMKYIIQNYGGKTAQEMADHLSVDVMNVRIFCQANAIEPLPSYTGKRKPKDSYHTIPEERKLRMKRVGYDPQKKTA